MLAWTTFCILSIAERLRRKGTSKRLKNFVWRRHKVYLIIFFLQSFVVISQKLVSTGDYNQNFFVGLILGLISPISGIMLAFTRLFEPYVWQTFK
jgi:hypothetical protein